MSIYSSLPAPGDPGYPAPLVYQCSGYWPSDDDERGGAVDIAAIMAGASFMRLGVLDEHGEATVVLDRAGVELVHRTLGEWLARTETAEEAR